MLLTAAELLKENAKPSRERSARRSRQRLPLHRLPFHRRRGGDGGEGAGGGVTGSDPAGLTPCVDTSADSQWSDPQGLTPLGRMPMNEIIKAREPRPAELLYRTIGAAAECDEAGRGARTVYRRHRPAAHAACRLRAQPACPRPHRQRRSEAGPGRARRAARVHRQGPGRALRSVGGDARALQGHEVGTAVSAAADACQLARRGAGRGGRRDPRDRRGWCRQGCDGL